MSNITWREVEPASVAIIPTDADTVILAGPNAAANSRLFDAARDLLEALKDFADDCELSASEAVLERALAAIAKAEGR